MSTNKLKKPLNPLQERFEQLVKDGKSHWKDVEGFDEDHAFLIKLVEAQFEFIKEVYEDSYEGTPFYNSEDDIWEKLEERMRKDI